jgi:hypothetical protein
VTLEEVLKKAREGGYHINGSEGMDTDSRGAHRDGAACTRNDTTSTCLGTMEDTFLDPLFWRALGLALGWYEGVATSCLVYEQWWRQPWHRFIDHLADGHTPETFFARMPVPAHTAPLRQHV